MNNIQCSDAQLDQAKLAIIKARRKGRDFLVTQLGSIFPDIKDETELILYTFEQLELKSEEADIYRRLFEEELTKADLLVKADKIERRRLHTVNAVSEFSAADPNTLFHSLSTARLYFEKEVDKKAKEYMFEQGLGTYINDNKFINIQLKILKNDLFKDVVDFLIRKNVLNKKDYYQTVGKTDIFAVNLFNPNNWTFNTRSYPIFKDVLKKLHKELLRSEGYVEFNKRRIPNIQGTIAKNKDVYDVYNAAVLLSNFDNIMLKRLGRIIDVNGSVFNSFEDPTQGNKYVFKPKGKVEEYWLDDNHMSESAEELSDQLSDLFITTIERKDKQNGYSGDFLTKNDFYALSALIDSFERKNIKRIADGEDTLIGRDPRRMFVKYIEEIRTALYKKLNKKNTTLTKEQRELTDLEVEYYNHFRSVADTIFSLYDYIQKIKRKDESAEDISIFALLGNVLNNSFGAVYGTYGAVNKNLSYKELYSHDTAAIAAQEKVYARLLSNKDKQYLYKEEEVDKLETNQQFSNFIYEKFGLYIDESEIEDLKDNVEEFAGEIQGLSGVELQNARNEKLRNHLKAALGAIINTQKDENEVEFNLFDKIEENENTILNGNLENEQSKSSVISPLTNKLQGVLNTYLIKQKSTPLTTIEMTSGEKIPTFKLSNLSYNDSETLLRQYEYEKDNENTSYRNLFVNTGNAFTGSNDPILMGTTTKLELVARDINKSASGWTPIENFTASFQSDFIGLATNSKLKWYNVIIGNYSDKNTILAKQINKNTSINGQRVFGGEDIMSLNDLTEFARVQQFSFLSDTYRDIITKYNKIFGLTLSTDIRQRKTSFNTINEELSKIDEDTLMKKAEEAGVDLVDQKDYSVYNKTVLRLNQNLFDYIEIYSSKAKFNNFLERDLDNTVFDIINSDKSENGKYLFKPSDIEKLGEFGLAGVLKFYGLEENALDSFIEKSTKITGTEEELDIPKQVEVVNVLVRNADGEINPLLKRWYMTNMLFRNEYLNMTVKHEYMHKAKGFPARNFDELGNYDAFMVEASPRYSGMAKRNVAFTSTFERPVQNFKYGVPAKLNIAIIQDPETLTYNINGDQFKQEFQDGSSTISYAYSRMIAASYPGKSYNNTLKRFGTFITDTGSAVKKDAEQVLTNKLIQRSESSPINYFQKQKQMLSSHTIEIGKVELNTEGLVILENGRYYKLHSIKINNNQLVRNMTEVDVEGNPLSNENVQEPAIQINTLFDVWMALGAQYSGKFEGTTFKFDEGSNDTLYRVIIAQPDLKNKMIHIISNFSTFKSGAINVNPSTRWNNDETLRYATLDGNNIGPQLDAGHAADSSKIKEISQVLSALSQSDTTSDIAHEAYQDIARLIIESAKPYLKTLENLDSKEVQNAILDISRDLTRHIANSRGATLASSLITVFDNNAILPFSNQNFFEAFIQNLMVKLNTEFIARYYNGLGAVLLPSHNAVQVYEKDGIVYTQDSIITDAVADFNMNNPEGLVLSNSEIIKNFVGKTFTPTYTTLDQAQLGDIIVIGEQEFNLNNPTEYYRVKHKLGFNTKTPIQIRKDVPRDLKPQELTYEVMEMPKGSFRDKVYRDLNLAQIPKKILDRVKFVSAKEIQKIANKEHTIEGITMPNGDILINEELDEVTRKAKIIHEIVGHAGVSALFSGKDKALYKDVLDSAKDYLFENAEELLKGSGFTFEEAKAAYGEEQLIEELLARQAEQDVKLNWLEKAIGRIQVLLGKTFGMKAPMGREGVIELLLMSKKALVTGKTFSIQLKEDEGFFPVITRKTLFDLDPVRLKYALEDPDNMSAEDLAILTEFANKFNLWDGDQFDKKKMDMYLRQWTQRLLAFLDDRVAVPDVSEFNNLDEYFNGDSLVGMIYEDAKDFYSPKNIQSYQFKGAELILSNIYKTTFSTSEDVVKIKQQGYQFFKDKLVDTFTDDGTSKADFKIILPTNEEVRVKLVKELPLNKIDPSLVIRENNKIFRLDKMGNKLYQVPKDSVIIVEEGRDIIYLKASKYNAQTDQTVVYNYGKELGKLLGSFKEIKALVPILGDTIKDVVDSNGNPVNIENELMELFLRFTEVNMAPTGNAKQWYLDNKDSILDIIARKQFVSWDKSRYFIAARIPAQSMQSFMPMENIAYFDDDSNNAYVSIWQIWLQGSDFDIDKAYLMGYGFNRNSQLDLWTDMFDYSTKEGLDVLELLPIPTNTLAEFDQNGFDITLWNRWFNRVIKKAGNFRNHMDIANSMSISDIKTFAEVLGAVKEHTGDMMKNAAKNNVPLESIKLKGNEALIDFINRYNSYTGHVNSQFALQNSIVSKINRTISAPSNQLLATMPVTIQDWHDGAEAGKEYREKRIRKIVVDWVNSKDKEKPSIKALITTLAGVNPDAVNNDYTKLQKNKKKLKATLIDDIVNEINTLITKVERFSPTNSFGMFKQQHQAIIGKSDVGIGANGLKVTFALSDYYNKWLTDVRKGKTQINPFDNKLFHKTLYVNGEEKPITHIADIKITEPQVKEIMNLYGYDEAVKEYNAYVALSMSGFVSGATDNAKELVMAKINAVVDLAAMHIYMLTLGYSPNEISTYMNSDLAKFVAEGLESNLFSLEKKKQVKDLVSEYADKPEVSKLIDPEELSKMTSTFMSIYYGAREFSSLASIFKVNTSIKANADELHKFLGNIENAMYSPEVKTFEFLLKSLKTPLNKMKADRLTEIVKKIMKSNPTLQKMAQKNPNATAEYIEQVLRDAEDIPVFFIDYDGKEKVRRVSVKGGEFDARYYVHPKNIQYRNATIAYYNLIKDTVNIFDVLEEVPHFREMVHSVGVTFQMATIASKKFNWVFSKLRNIIRDSKNIKLIAGNDRHNDRLKNLFGNDAIRLKMDEGFIKRALRTFDTYLISSWLRSDDKKVTELKFTVKDLLREAGLKKITLYTSDKAKVYSDTELGKSKGTNLILSDYAKVITVDGNEDMVIDLTTDHGIANFKIIAEQVLLPILKKNNASLGNLLTLRSIKNHLGTSSTQIVPTFGLSNLNNAVSAENFSKSVNAMNEIDRQMSFKVTNTSSKPLMWRDLFYVYNLIMNNEAYGDLRLTPLFQDYAKEKGSIAESFLKYSLAVDSGEVDIFELDPIGGAEGDLQKRQLNNILFSIFNNRGFLEIQGRKLKVVNNNFLINTTLASTDYRDGLNFQLVKAISSQLKNQNLIINYICQ